MSKQHALETQFNMFTIACQNNSVYEIENLLHTWDLKTLYKFLDKPLLEDQQLLIVNVIEQKEEEFYEILKSIVDAYAITEAITEFQIKIIINIRKEFPTEAWHNIIKQDDQLKKFFKYNWAMIKNELGIK